MVKVCIINKTRDKKIDQFKTKIKKVLLAGVEFLKIKKDLEINIIFVNSAEIKKQNLKYFKKKSPTDVISLRSGIPIQNSRLLGDIIICPEQAAKNAQKLNHNLEKEIQILVLHGLLHLTGLDHEKPEDLSKWQKIFKNLEKRVE